MGRTANLDALVARADFDLVENTSQSRPPQTIQIRDVKALRFLIMGFANQTFSPRQAVGHQKKISTRVREIENKPCARSSSWSRGSFADWRHNELCEHYWRGTKGL